MEQRDRETRLLPSYYAACSKGQLAERNGEQEDEDGFAVLEDTQVKPALL